MDEGHGVYVSQEDRRGLYLGKRCSGKVPLYWDFMLEAKEKVEAKVAELGIPWETDDYQPLPDWKPGCGFDVENPDYDIIPVYYTDAVNTDSWLMENPWMMRSMKANPYGYTIEMNKGDCGGEGPGERGQRSSPKLSEGVSVRRQACGFRRRSMPLVCIGYRWRLGVRSLSSCLSRKDKGVPIVHLSSWARRPIAWTISAPHLTSASASKSRKSLKGVVSYGIWNAD